MERHKSSYYPCVICNRIGLVPVELDLAVLIGLVPPDVWPLQSWPFILIDGNPNNPHWLSSRMGMRFHSHSAGFSWTGRLNGWSDSDPDWNPDVYGLHKERRWPAAQLIRMNCIHPPWTKCRRQRASKVQRVRRVRRLQILAPSVQHGSFETARCQHFRYRTTLFTDDNSVRMAPGSSQLWLQSDSGRLLMDAKPPGVGKVIIAD